MDKSCENCVSRFICPNNYRTCAGWNDEGLFWGLLKLSFPNGERVDHMREFIKSIQTENRIYIPKSQREATHD